MQEAIIFPPLIQAFRSVNKVGGGNLLFLNGLKFSFDLIGRTISLLFQRRLLRNYLFWNQNIFIFNWVLSILRWFCFACFLSFFAHSSLHFRLNLSSALRSISLNCTLCNGVDFVDVVDFLDFNVLQEHIRIYVSKLLDEFTFSARFDSRTSNVWPSAPHSRACARLLRLVQANVVVGKWVWGNWRLIRLVLLRNIRLLWFKVLRRCLHTRHTTWSVLSQSFFGWILSQKLRSPIFKSLIEHSFHWVGANCLVSVLAPDQLLESHVVLCLFVLVTFLGRGGSGWKSFWGFKVIIWLLSHILPWCVLHLSVSFWKLHFSLAWDVSVSFWPTRRLQIS